MARGRGGKTGGGGKSSGGSRGGGGCKSSQRTVSAPRPTPKPRPPKPTKISTINTSVQTANTGRVNPKSITTNNPQVATQNNPQATNTVQKVQQVVKQMGLTQVHITERPPTTFDPSELTINVNATQNPSMQLSDIQVHKETREIITTNGIKTTFVPTDQQTRILQAMENQKEQELKEGKSAWQINQDKLQAKIADMEAQKQKTEEFRNRSTEETLRNFIDHQLNLERTQDTGTNFTQYVTQEGFDPNKPETIPTTIFNPTKLDTREKMEKAGLAPRIINLRLESMGKSPIVKLVESTLPEITQVPQIIQRLRNTDKPQPLLSPTISMPPQTIAKRTTTVPTPKFQRSMASRVDVFHAKRTGTPVIVAPSQIQTIKLASSPTSRSFVPQIQHQASEPIGQVAVGKATSVTTMGFGSTPTNLISKIGLTELLVAEAILIGGIAILTKKWWK